MSGISVVQQIERVKGREKDYTLFKNFLSHFLLLFVSKLFSKQIFEKYIENGFSYFDFFPQNILAKLFSQKMLADYGFPYYQNAGIKLPRYYENLFWDTVASNSTFFQNIRWVTSDKLLDINHKPTLSFPGSKEDTNNSRELDWGFKTTNLDVALMSQNIPFVEIEEYKSKTAAIIVKEAGKKFAQTLDNTVFYGDGDAKPFGLATSKNAESGKKNPNNSVHTIEQMINKMPIQYQKDAKWYCNRTTGRILRTLRDDSGDYICEGGFLPAKMFGIEIIYNDQMQSLGVNGNVPLIFANFDEAYQIGARRNVSMRRFDDGSFAEKDMTLVISRIRYGGSVINEEAVISYKINDNYLKDNF